MKLRKYPKVLEFYHLVASMSIRDRKHAFNQIVWSDTEYNAYYDRYKEKYIVTERLPNWEEVKGKNLFLKIWYVLPNWVLAIFAALALLISWFHEQLLQGIIKMFRG